MFKTIFSQAPIVLFHLVFLVLTQISLCLFQLIRKEKKTNKQQQNFELALRVNSGAINLLISVPKYHLPESLSISYFIIKVVHVLISCFLPWPRMSLFN